MSYFDDHEDWLVYGRRISDMPRGIGRSKPVDPGVALGQVEVVMVYPSGKALKVRMKDNDEQTIPFSQIHEDSKINRENCEPETVGELSITTWLAEQKDLTDGGGDGF